MNTPVAVDDRDCVTQSCTAYASDRYGRMNCYDCARALGTVYADGWQGGCVRLPANYVRTGYTDSGDVVWAPRT